MKKTKREWLDLDYSEKKEIRREWKKSYWYKAANKDLFANPVVFLYIFLILIGSLILFGSVFAKVTDTLYNSWPIGLAVMFVFLPLLAAYTYARLEKAFNRWLLLNHQITKD